MTASSAKELTTDAEADMSDTYSIKTIQTIGVVDEGGEKKGGERWRDGSDRFTTVSLIECPCAHCISDIWSTHGFIRLN